MPWESDVRDDIKTRLMATGAFDDVWTTGLPEDCGRSSGQFAAAATEPGTGEAVSRWDDMALAENIQVPLTLFAKHQDPETRDRLLDRLKETAEAAITGQSLAGITCPLLTILRRWRPGPVRHPERRLACVVQYTALLDRPALAITDDPS